MYQEEYYRTIGGRAVKSIPDKNPLRLDIDIQRAAQTATIRGLTTERPANTILSTDTKDGMPQIYSKLPSDSVLFSTGRRFLELLGKGNGLD